MDRRIPLLLFGWVLAAAGIWCGLFFQGAGGPEATSHPQLSSLLVGGDGAARVKPVFVWGAALGFTQIGFLVTALLLGFAPSRRARILRFAILAGFVHAAAFGALLLGYHAFLAAPAANFEGPFPLPTSILLFVLGPAPLLYLVLFLSHFDAWLPSAKAEARLAELREAQASAKAAPR